MNYVNDTLIARERTLNVGQVRRFRAEVKPLN